MGRIKEGADCVLWLPAVVCIATQAIGQTTDRQPVSRRRKTCLLAYHQHDHGDSLSLSRTYRVGGHTSWRKILLLPCLTAEETKYI